MTERRQSVERERERERDRAKDLTLPSLTLFSACNSPSFLREKWVSRFAAERRPDTHDSTIIRVDLTRNAHTSYGGSAEYLLHAAQLRKDVQVHLLQLGLSMSLCPYSCCATSLRTLASCFGGASSLVQSVCGRCLAGLSQSKMVLRRK